LEQPAAEGREQAVPATACESEMPINKVVKPDRSKINMQSDEEVMYWCKHLGVSPTQLQKVVEKVGNSASAVEKELGF
jgi:hypothetical protein